MGDSRVWEEVQGGGVGGLDKVFRSDSKVHSQKEEEEEEVFWDMQRF